jgi:protein SCO1
MASLRMSRWLLLGVAIVQLACSRTPSFQGDALDAPRPTLDFTLTDQSGQPVRLSALRGEVVVLTFLYTSCVDACPLLTQKLHQVSAMLGARRRRIALLAVTVDPGRDTVPRIAEYSRHWHMQDRWRLLTGAKRDLEPVWRYYWVGADERDPPSTGSGYEIDHASPLHLIDRAGRVRVVYGGGFRPAQLAHDIEILLDQG